MRLILAVLMLCSIYPQGVTTKNASDREHDGFAGPVKSVSVEYSTIYEFNSRGDWVKRKETTEETFNRKTISWKIRQIEYFPSN